MEVLLNSNIYVNSAEIADARRKVIFRLALILAGLACYLTNDHLAAGAFPGWLSEILAYGHSRYVVCPLCGGVRAFVWCCGLDFRMAFHANILGSLVAIWMFLTLPVYVCQMFGHLGGIYGAMCRMEGRKTYSFIFLMAICFLTQIVLHYCFGYTWIPLQQFLEQ